jgi:hypothetical protein
MGNELGILQQIILGFDKKMNLRFDNK